MTRPYKKNGTISDFISPPKWMFSSDGEGFFQKSGQFSGYVGRNICLWPACLIFFFLQDISTSCTSCGTSCNSQILNSISEFSITAVKVKSWTINHFWQCHKQRHLLAFFLKNPRNHRENCPHIWKSPHPLKKTPVLGQKESPKLSHFFCMAPSHILNVFFAKKRVQMGQL